MSYRVLVADAEYLPTAGELRARFPQLDLTFLEADDHLAAALAAGNFQAVVVSRNAISAQLLESSPSFPLLIKLGRVYDNVDANALRARSIRMGLVPRKGPNCVAELAITLILALSKDLLMAHEAVADGAYRYRGLQPRITAQWKMAFRWMQHAAMHEVVGKTLGVVGMGEIGVELARRAAVMGMRVLYHKRNRLPAELEQEYGVEYRALNPMLDESDYVCLAVPHTADTERMIGAEELQRIGPNGYLVNICRGGVVDEGALIEALKTGAIAGAGLDVFTYEPLPHDSPLCSLHNVILTPHIGGGTGTTRAGELAAGLEEAWRAMDGHPLRIPRS